MNTEKHEFALYFAGLSQAIAAIHQKDDWFVDDEILCHRVSKILRLEGGDELVFFDREMNARCMLRMMQGKRRIVFQLLTKEKNAVLVPRVTCVLPLLKRDDFESAVYMLAELGVNDIQLVLTEKSVRSWGKEKEYERLERIIIAAAEQSKYFAMPIIHAPILLDKLCVPLQKNNAVKIYFDGEGEPLLHQVNRVARSASKDYILMVGPEGDLTANEKQLMRDVGFAFCRLTPTTLRAVHAVCLGVGVFRSL